METTMKEWIINNVLIKLLLKKFLKISMFLQTCQSFPVKMQPFNKLKASYFQISKIPFGKAYGQR